MINWSDYTPLERRLLRAIVRGLNNASVDGYVGPAWSPDALATWVIPGVSRTVNRLLKPPAPRKRKQRRQSRTVR
jgi:hypothetical protein